MPGSAIRSKIASWSIAPRRQVERLDCFPVSMMSTLFNIIYNNKYARIPLV